jgi:hypothetical protein
MTTRSRTQAGSALLAVLLGLVVLTFIATIAASLAALSRRSARGALDAVSGQAAIEAELETPRPPVPPLPGSSLELGFQAPPPAGWVGHRRLTRLASGMVMVRATLERPGDGGALLARSEGFSLWLVGDSGRVSLAPGGWVSDP